jgi:hypothetical protein
MEVLDTPIRSKTRREKYVASFLTIASHALCRRVFVNILTL